MSRAPEVFDAEDRPLLTVARNVSTRWLAIVIEALIGLVMLPYNVAHLGTEAYGLWVLTASVTVHFSILNLGYGGALVKFIAQYRAHRNVQALNEIASSLFGVFTLAGCVAYAILVAVAFNLAALFHLTAEQAELGKLVLLVIGVNVALNFPFSVYGGIVTGFQRNHLNSGIAIGSSVLVALANVAAIEAGYGLVGLVLATTTVRVMTYFVYRANALRIYPALEIKSSLFRRSRLREVTGFSVSALIIDWANKLNYQADSIVIGAVLGPAPIAVWSVANRLVVVTQTLSNQLNGVLFPVIVDSDASKRHQRLRQILLEGTRLSFVMVLPISIALIALGEPLVRRWVGAGMLESVPVLQILAVAVAIRVGNATGNTVLKGAGQHRLLAWVNLTVGIGNVALSVVLVRWIGLRGVALATLIAVLSAAAYLYPVACRRVGVPFREALAHSILPTIWPALVVCGLLVLTRDVLAVSLLGILLHSALGAALYLALFLVAIGRRDRANYVAKVRGLISDHRLARLGRQAFRTSSSAGA